MKLLSKNAMSAVFGVSDAPEPYITEEHKKTITTATFIDTGSYKSKGSSESISICTTLIWENAKDMIFLCIHYK